MKKLLLSGLCAAMLAGSSHQADACEFTLEIPQDCLVAGTLIVGAAVVIAGGAAGLQLCEIGLNVFFGHSEVEWVEYRYPEVFEILKDSFLSREEMAECVMELYRRHEYKCHTAIADLENVTRRFERVSREFRALEKWYVFSRCARARRKIVDNMREHASDLIVTLRESETYAAEKAEKERVNALDRGYKVTLDKVEDLGVEIS